MPSCWDFHFLVAVQSRDNQYDLETLSIFIFRVCMPCASQEMFESDSSTANFFEVHWPQGLILPLIMIKLRSGRAWICDVVGIT